jgi:hypothetical protein
LIIHAEKINTCSEARKSMLWEGKIQLWKQQKEKLLNVNNT